MALGSAAAMTREARDILGNRMVPGGSGAPNINALLGGLLGMGNLGSDGGAGAGGAGGGANASGGVGSGNARSNPAVSAAARQRQFMMDALSRSNAGDNLPAALFSVRLPACTACNCLQLPACLPATAR